MKKIAFVLFAVLLFSACKKEQPIVGDWQIISVTNEDEFYVNNTVRYTFNADKTGMAVVSQQNDTIRMTQLEWYLSGDTLIYYDANADPEYPVMPAIMLVEKIDQQEMTWRYLILGDVWIYLKRI